MSIGEDEVAIALFGDNDTGTAVILRGDAYRDAFGGLLYLLGGEEATIVIVLGDGSGRMDGNSGEGLDGYLSQEEAANQECWCFHGDDRL